MMCEFIPKPQTDQFIEQLPVLRLKYLEEKYGDYLEQLQMSDDDYENDDETNHVLDLLNTRDKITCRINKLAREESLSPIPNKNMGEKKEIKMEKKKRVSLVTPALQLTSQELFCGYAYNHSQNKCSKKDCGCLVMFYGHADFPPLKLCDLCAHHKNMQSMVEQYQRELTNIVYG
jgi:hypothetical protein